MTLPSLNPVPDNIDEHIQRLIQNPSRPELGPWLAELIKNSGHMSTGDDMRWRLLCVVWLAVEFDVEQAWSYLMWLNMREPVISTHLSQILIEAVDDFNAHVQMANWINQVEDERLVKFFQDFQPVPAQRKVPALMSALMTQAAHPKIGVWLDMFCRGTLQDGTQYLRPWRLLAAAWYAAGFDPDRGLTYLKALTDNGSQLSAADQKLLMKAAEEAKGLTPIIEMIAACPNPAVRTMLQDFGHPDPAAVVEDIFAAAPDYGHLADAAGRAEKDVDAFKRIRACLEEASISTASAEILDLACGPLAPQTLLLASAGYKTTGVGLEIPPGYLPLPNALQWFKRNKYKKAWQEAANAYYQSLASQSGLKLKWGKAKIELADPTRLEMADNRFEAVVCINYLQHAPDVAGLVSEAARVLKPGGLFLADIRPFAGLYGAFQNDAGPWQHLRENTVLTSKLNFNKWREAQYKALLEKHFTVEQWLPEPDPQAQQQLTPELKAELSDFSEAELTCRWILIAAKKM